MMFITITVSQCRLCQRLRAGGGKTSDCMASRFSSIRSNTPTTS
ncbi:hypothetical protein ECBCE030MS09_3303 [Escherichia coli BCE030_MS-09]|nr:hypothetical protein ECBCE030MS09_3303 [Escherichia coli BCE030_MS-09]